jgi:hypothetical protein
MALDTTIGGSTTDSYVDIDDTVENQVVVARGADSYFADHYHVAKATTWADLTTAQKESVLRAAANVLDTLRFTDSLVYPAYWNQSRTFPRNIDWDNGYYIPPEVRDAQCEQAIFLVSFDESAYAAQIQGIYAESIQAGPVRISTQYGGRTGSAVSPTMVSPLAFELVRPYIRRSSQRLRA